MIEVSVKGLEKVNQMLGNLSNMDAYDDAMKEIAITAMYLAKQYAPVDTGMLEQDIRYYRNGPASYTILADPVDENGRHYAVYNEYGTYRMPAGTPNSPLAVRSTSGKYAFRPFMRPAAIQAQRMAPYILSRHLSGVIK